MNTNTPDRRGDSGLSRGEQAFRVTATENRFELLVQSVVDYAIYMLDPQGRVSSWNRGAQQIKGYRAEEVLGHSYAMFFTAEERARGQPEAALAVASREGRYNGEGWRVRRDGSRFRAMVAIDAIRDAHGRLIGFAKVTRDVTARWEAQVRMEESERRFRLLMDAAPDYAICMLDAGGRIDEWNAGMRRISGHRAESVLGGSIHCLYTPEDRAAGLPEHMLREALAHGRYEADHWCLREDGSRLLAHIALIALREADGTLRGYAHVTRDLSQIHAAETELASTREQLFHAQKLEALGQLTGGIAHDFNNILQAISGSLEIARAQGERGRPDLVERHLDSAIRSVERAAQLTRRLLAAARRQPLRPACVDVNALVRSMGGLLERTLGGNVRLRIALAKGALHVMCDAGQLENALLNLAINGRDAMSGGGTLTIGSRAVAGEGGEAGFVALSVADTGVGMSPEMAARVFDPFFTTKPLGRGTGLGLSIIHGFVKQSKGQIHLATAPGQGTCVELRLPGCTPEAAT
ncbi:hybrid sensor histidine kinase/response regulator [Frateuria defendens]|uniref:hybrid sensor histidine kinase/response regulator n=1 Tax=Frateuria defendens TaxID=2219559 RepID=UPI00069E1F06|nr:PAS domain-containing sensor histidine kinase [Frateuria defendens]